ncbi:MAG: O-antigen ligase family protein [Alphaproteobacteria bacterium]|nr:O-antigen ligase family protein [Alphaproteobacteria bacterium]
MPQLNATAVFGTIALVFALLAIDPVAYEPHHVRWIACGVFAACLVAATGGRGLDPRRDGLTLATYALICGAALSLAWSAEPVAGIASLGHAIVATLVFLCARALTSRARAALARIVALCVAAVLTAWSFGVGAWGGIGNPNFLSETLVLSAPFVALAAGREQRRGARYVFVAVTIVALAATIIWLPSRAGAVAAGMIVCVFAFAFAPVALRKGLPIAAIIGALAIGLIVVDGRHLHQSFDSRMQLWTNGAAMLADRPILGIGLGAFDALYPLYQERHLRNLPPDAAPVVLLDRKSIRAGALHNEALQFVLTLGALGVVLLVAFASMFIRQMQRSFAPENRLEFAAAAAGVAGCAILAMTGFPLQLPHSQILTALLLAFLVPMAPDAPPKGLASAAPILLVPLVVWFAVLAYGQHLLGRSLATIATDPAGGMALAQRARLFAFGDPAAKAWSFVAIVRRAELEPGFVPERAALDAEYRASDRPRNSSLLVLSARLQYLVNFGADPADDVEAEHLADWLTANASRIQDFWILAAALKLKRGDPQEAARRIEIARGLTRQNGVEAFQALLAGMADAASAEIAAGHRRRLPVQIQLGFDRV